MRVVFSYARSEEKLKRLAGEAQRNARAGTLREAAPGADAVSRASGARVTFEPGARTAWHTHPLGQTLIVTGGAGWVQQWGGPIQDIRPGDVVRIPPGQKHWHGATATTGMTHIAIQEHLDGKTVDWMEMVSDVQYGAPVRAQESGGATGGRSVPGASAQPAPAQRLIGDFAPNWSTSRTTSSLAMCGRVRTCPRGIAAW